MILLLWASGNMLARPCVEQKFLVIGQATSTLRDWYPTVSSRACPQCPQDIFEASPLEVSPSDFCCCRERCLRLCCGNPFSQLAFGGPALWAWSEVLRVRWYSLSCSGSLLAWGETPDSGETAWDQWWLLPFLCICEFVPFPLQTLDK